MHPPGTVLPAFDDCAIHRVVLLNPACQVGRRASRRTFLASLEERFEAQVDRSGEHRRWLGAVNADRGTGRLKVAGKHVTAHRFAWELDNGPLPAGARVLACEEEPACVRLDHLRIEGLRRRRPRSRTMGCHG